MNDALPIRAGLFTADTPSPHLIVGVCAACAKPHFPAEASCPYCGGDAATELVGPRGIVRLSTIVHRSPPGYHDDVPYGFGVVEIDGYDLQVISRLGLTSGDAPGVGTPVALALVPIVIDDDGTRAITWQFEVQR